MAHDTDLYAKSHHSPTRWEVIAVNKRRTARNIATMCAILICSALTFLRPAPPDCAAKIKELQQATTERYITQEAANRAK